jgi:hypothetical protein
MDTKCLNCDAEYNGNFCPQCGQKQSTHKITLTTILHDIPHAVFHIDKGFLFTFRTLFYKPGKAIRDYLNGKRVNYFSPFAYLLLLCAASTFIDHLTSRYLHRHSVGNGWLLFPQLAVFFNHYPALMWCLLVPFISFWSWLFNKHSGYNYWENFIMNVYLIAQFNLFFIATKLIELSTHMFIRKVTPMLVCFIAYLVFAYLQFFPIRKGFIPALARILMFLLIAFTIINGLTFAGFMTKYWWW